MNKEDSNKLCQSSFSFTWEELDCFLRPQAMLFDSLEKGAGNWYLYLTSFYNLFRIGGLYKGNCNFTDRSIDYTMFSQDILTPLFNHKIEKTDIKISLFDSIIKALDKNQLVIVPIDKYGLYYYSDFRKKHELHCLLLTGYDKERKLFYINDYLQNINSETIRYTDFVIEYDLIADLHRLFSLNISGEEPQTFIFQIELNLKYQIDEKKLLWHMTDLLRESTENQNNLETVENYYLNRITDIHEHNLTDQINYVTNLFFKEINFKNVYYKSLLNILKKYCSEQGGFDWFDTIINEINYISDPLKGRLFANLLKNKPINTESIIEKVNKIKSLDIQLMKDTICSLKKIL